MSIVEIIGYVVIGTICLIGVGIIIGICWDFFKKGFKLGRKIKQKRKKND